MTNHGAFRRRAFVAAVCLLLGSGMACAGRDGTAPVGGVPVPSVAEQWFANYHDAERQGLMNVPAFLDPKVVVDYSGLGHPTARGRDAALALLGTQWNQSTRSRAATAPVYLSETGAIDLMRIRNEFAGPVDAVSIYQMGRLGITSEVYAESELGWHIRGTRDPRLPETLTRGRGYVHAWSSADPEALRALYAADAVLVDDLSAVWASGVDAIGAIAETTPGRGALPQVTLELLADLGGPASFPVGRPAWRGAAEPLESQVLLVTADDGTGCPGQMAVALRLDADGLIVQEHRYHRVDALVRCSAEGTLPSGWWDDVTIPPAIASELTGTLDLGGQVVEVYNASNGLDELVEWAFNRFTSAGLTPPKVNRVTFVDKRADQCGNIIGLIQDRQVTLCFLGKVCINDACDRWTRSSEATALHELAHAWMDDNVDAATRDRFLKLADLSDWSGADVPWGERGVELAATTIAWGLLEEETAIDRKLGPRTCRELTDLFVLLVGDAARPFAACTGTP